jgi:hypothetical protein
LINLKAHHWCGNPFAGKTFIELACTGSPTKIAGAAPWHLLNNKNYKNQQE